MTGVQLDQFAALIVDQGGPASQASEVARELVARWRGAGYAETGQLSLGEPWVRATRKGIEACGLRSRTVAPPSRALRHMHAVTDVRLAVQRTTAFREGQAWWRAERSLLAGQGYLAGAHPPDGKVHWPVGTGSPWAGEIWAVEVEISPKSVSRTVAIMQEILAQAGDYGKPGGSIAVPGPAPRYARLVYVCSARTVRTVLNAKAAVGSPLSARIDVHDLPVSAIQLSRPKRGWQA
jgi:hypothetical protein